MRFGQKSPFYLGSDCLPVWEYTIWTYSPCDSCISSASPTTNDGQLPQLILHWSSERPPTLIYRMKTRQNANIDNCRAPNQIFNIIATSEFLPCRHHSCFYLHHTVDLYIKFSDRYSWNSCAQMKDVSDKGGCMGTKRFDQMWSAKRSLLL